MSSPWGHSSVGRASRSQREGRRFDPGWLHHFADTYDESKDIDYVCHYVWNLDLRKTIYYIASELYDLITNQYANGNQPLNNVTIYANGTTIILSVAGAIIESVPVVGTIIGVSSLIASNAEIILDSINSSFKATRYIDMHQVYRIRMAIYILTFIMREARLTAQSLVSEMQMICRTY